MAKQAALFDWMNDPVSPVDPTSKGISPVQQPTEPIAVRVDRDLARWAADHPNDPPLVPYGIQTEASDIRCHVAPATRGIFVYKTCEMLDQLTRKSYRLAPAYQPGVSGPTGLGYPVPVSDVFDIVPLQLLDTWWDVFDAAQLTSRKGALAVDVVLRVIHTRWFPMWGLLGMESNDFDVQMSGTDMIVNLSGSLRG